jgi:hypothetical protein
MATFIKKLLLFIAGFFLLMFIGVLMPASRTARESFLFSKIDKDALMKNTPSPRIILVGGSNTSFSINSQMLKDSLHFNPVNTGISGALGLFYMLDHSVDNIRPGDVVIVCPEYSQFYGNAAYGEDYLIRIIMDISPSEMLMLRGKQLSTQLSFLPRYAFSKFKVTQYLPHEEDLLTKIVYKRVAFNQYGDVFKHWTMEKVAVQPYASIGERFNDQVIEKLLEYKRQVEKKRAVLFVTFPAFQSESFRNQHGAISRIEHSLKEKGFRLLGDPKRYRMPNDLIFDTPYHLTKDGVSIRTQLLIDDLKRSNISIYGDAQIAAH